MTGGIVKNHSSFYVMMIYHRQYVLYDTFIFLNYFDVVDGISSNIHTYIEHIYVQACLNVWNMLIFILSQKLLVDTLT